MKTASVLFSLMLLDISVSAQIAAEVFAGSERLQHEIFWGRTIDQKGKFSFFNYNRLAVSWHDRSKTDFMVYSTGIYNFNSTWGLAAGGYVSPWGFIPVAAVSYTYARGPWLINVFPTIELTLKPNGEVFAFANYRPQLGKKTKLFTQLIANSNFNLHRHNFSLQQLRVGLDYNGVQIGAGLDVTTMTLYEGIHQTGLNVGIFLRKEF